MRLMAVSPANVARVIFVTFLITAAFLCFSGCRRNRTVNSNNISSSSSVPSDPEEARKQAQSLVDQGRELYRNDQDEQAVDTFKQAIKNDPDNAEAHLRLGMS